MNRFLILLTTLFLAAAFAVSSFAQARLSVHEVPIPELNLGEDYRIPIISLLREGEDPADFRIARQPSLGTLVVHGMSLVYQPLADFHAAGGDVFTFSFAGIENQAQERLAFLSPAPLAAEQSFQHDFEETYGDLGVFPSDPSSVFSFVEAMPGNFSLGAYLDAGPAYVKLAQNIEILGNPTPTNGNWGGETDVIVCPDGDPGGGAGEDGGTTLSQPRSFPSKSQGGDGEVVVYKAGVSGRGTLLQLRIQHQGENWKVRAETKEEACVGGVCATGWLNLQGNGVRELVKIEASGDPFEGSLSLSIGSQFTSIPFGVRWVDLDHHRLGVMNAVGLEREKLLFDDFKVSGYFDLFEARVADGFEQGGFSEAWDDTSEANDLSISNNAALSGQLGLAANPKAIASSGGSSVLIETSEPAETYGTRFELDASDLALENGQSVSILGASSVSTHLRDHLRMSLVGTELGPALVVEVAGDRGGKQSTGQILLSPGPHVIVLRWQSGQPGNLRLWLDGRLASVISGVFNPTKRVSSVQVGLFNLNAVAPVHEIEALLKIDGFVAW